MHKTNFYGLEQYFEGTKSFWSTALNPPVLTGLKIPSSCHWRHIHSYLCRGSWSAGCIGAGAESNLGCCCCCDSTDVCLLRANAICLFLNKNNRSPWQPERKGIWPSRERLKLSRREGTKKSGNWRKQLQAAAFEPCNQQCLRPGFHNVGCAPHRGVLRPPGRGLGPKLV